MVRSLPPLAGWKAVVPICVSDSPGPHGNRNLAGRCAWRGDAGLHASWENSHSDREFWAGVVGWRFAR